MRVAWSWGESVTTNADAEGKWSTKFPALKAGGPYRLIVSSTNVIRIEDVWASEVWLCSYPSNMEWRVDHSLNSDEEIAAATDSLIRPMKAPHTMADTPRKDLSAKWMVCSPETAGEFTAAG